MRVEGWSAHFLLEASSMGSKIWRFELDHWDQVVEIEHGFLSGVKRIYVNGDIVEKDKENNFRIRNHNCKIDIRDSLFSSTYNLLVDGLVVGGGQEVKAPTSKSIPGWAWLFVAACIAIPIVSLGGCIPGAIGAGGAAGCAAVARSQDLPNVLKVVLCIVIAVVSWIVFVVFIWKFATGTLFNF
jgi:hypothetical protein